MIYTTNFTKFGCKAKSLIPQILTVLMLSVSLFNLKAQNNNTFTIFAGYTGSFNSEEHHYTTSYGGMTSLAFDMPVYKGLSFMPEGGFDFRAVDAVCGYEMQWSFVLRASAAYTFKLPKVNLTLLTGPRMNLSLANTDVVYEGGYMPDYNRISVGWQFGLGITYKRMVFRGTFALPLSDYIHYYYNGGKGYKTNMYELSVGYRFSANR